MDQEVPKQLPNGSPILAYGIAKRFTIGRKLLALIAGIFVIACAAAVIVTRGFVQFPDRLLALAAVRGNIQLPSGYPLAWTSVGQTPFPKFFGVAMTDAGPEPFAIIVGSSPQTTLNVDRSGAFAFVSEHPLNRTIPNHLYSIASFAAGTILHPAELRVDPSVLDPNIMERIEGPVDANGIWKTNIRIPSRDAQALPSMDLALDLTALPEAWPLIQTAVSKEGLSLDEIDPPTAFGWNMTSGALPNVELRYANGAATSTKLAFAAAAGLFDVQPYTLPGDVVGQELKTPKNMLAATSSNSWAIGVGAQLELAENSVSIKTIGIQGGSMESNEVCTQGRRLFSMKQAAIQSILTKINLQPFMPVRTIEAHELKGYLVVCVK